MAAYETLFETLQTHLDGMNKARIRFLAMLIIALIRAGTISNECLARRIETQSKFASVYRSIQRFFALFEIDSFIVAKLIASLVPIGRCGWILTVDRIHWKFGKEHRLFRFGRRLRRLRDPAVLGSARQTRQLQLERKNRPDAPSSPTSERTWSSASLRTESSSAITGFDI